MIGNSTKVMSGSSHPSPIDSVHRVVGAIGQGMRLVVPENGEQPYLLRVFPVIPVIPILPSSTIPVPKSIAEQAIKEAHLLELTKDGEFYKGKQIRGGYKEFYSGPPAKIYCLVQ